MKGTDVSCNLSIPNGRQNRVQLTTADPRYAIQTTALAAPEPTHRLKFLRLAKFGGVFVGDMSLWVSFQER